MTKHTLVSAEILLASVLAVLQPLSAQTGTSRSLERSSLLESGSVFDEPAVALPQSLDLRALGLDKRERFSFFPATARTASATPNFLPAFRSSVESRPTRAVVERDWYDQLEETRANRIHIGGEVDLLYGKFTGKDGGDFKRGYILGEIGNEKFNISVGAAYLEFDGRHSRRDR